MSVDWTAAVRRFGFDEFRPGQREAVEILMAERRLLLVAPTGGGKSLSYQLPASVLPGTSLVISPLIALMNDQVSALTAHGVAATFLASTLGHEDIRARCRGIGRGEYRLVYVAPERLRSPDFLSLVDGLDCPLVAVDEAHCISEWGHDFRPEYMEIGELIGRLPDARVLACTATATPVVRDEILARLGLGAETPQLVRGFARPNLSLNVEEVRSADARRRAVDRVLADTIGAPGAGRGTAIVYAPTRKATEEHTRRLRGDGWASDAYHAGLAAAARNRAQDEFLGGRLEVIVATNAFGMGIDRADVRAVVHLAPPSSIEAYYQEVGRAGRDGKPAVGHLCFAANDLPLRRALIERDGGGEGTEIVAHKWNLFLELIRWAEGGSCRHDAILRYFGDEEETLSGCGRCDVCRRLAVPDGHTDEEVSVIVRKTLSAVARLRGRFGLTAAVKLLRGVDDVRLSRTGLDQTKTFGALADRDEEWLTRLVRRCLTAGWVDFRGGDRPVVVLTDAGREVVIGDRPARLVLPPESIPRSPRKRGVSRRVASSPVSEEALTADEMALFERLRAHRLTLARQSNVPPYVVASDRTLRDLARLRPTSRAQLLHAHGIGETKADRYGDGFLAVIGEAHRD